jgi:hypothetical protein
MKQSQVIPEQRLSQAPSRLPAQYRAGQQLTGDNRAAPANNLSIKIWDASRKRMRITAKQ